MTLSSILKFRHCLQLGGVSELAAKRLEDKDSAAAKILAVEPTLEANFSTTAALRQKQTKARRWAPNPEEYWGPKAAARGKKKARK